MLRILPDKIYFIYTQVALNTIFSGEILTDNIMHGRWDEVLLQVSQLHLPQQVLQDLVEQIVLEMIHLKEFDTVFLLMQTKVMNIMSQEQPSRFAKLERLVKCSTRSNIDNHHFDLPKKIPRASLAKTLLREITVAPPSQMLTLIGQALKWQREKNKLSPDHFFDLFRSANAAIVDAVEACPASEHCTINFGLKTCPQCACFSSDGQLLATGSVDGLVELWNWFSGKLERNLHYQEAELFFMHSSSVLALDFSRNSDLLVSASLDGEVKVWQVNTGQCIRKFEKAHPQGICSVVFNYDSSQLLSVSTDGAVRIHGIKSGKMLKELSSERTVKDAKYTTNGFQIITGTLDGIVQVWDSKSMEIIEELYPPVLDSSGRRAAIKCIIPLNNSPGQFVVCTTKNTVHVMTSRGQVAQSFSCKLGKGDLVSCVVSPKCDWIYILREDGNVIFFSVKSSEVEKLLLAHDELPLGICHHPHRAVLATFSMSGTLRLWVP